MYTRSLNVLAWPAHEALRKLKRSDGIFVIGIATTPTNDRTAARRQIRAALGEALAVLGGGDASRIEFNTGPGRPPQLTRSSIGVSISHEVGMSVAAIYLHGAVGIDIVRRDTVARSAADWLMLARDYLGPAALERINDAEPIQRQTIFATEWTAQEARLKCRGLGLVEWNAAPKLIAEFVVHPLVLPQSLIGMLAIEKRRA